VEERIRRVRENFNLTLTGRPHELAEINAKLDALTKKVDALNRALAAKKPAAKKSVRKAPARKKK
jgi:uncharacterized coiled-coil protein SlyX